MSRKFRLYLPGNKGLPWAKSMGTVVGGNKVEDPLIIKMGGEKLCVF